MIMFRPKSIQQRLTIFMLLPVFLLLIGMGVAGYSYARKSLVGEWREAVILEAKPHLPGNNLKFFPKYVRLGIGPVVFITGFQRYL